jgi:hypothetical protein
MARFILEYDVEIEDVTKNLITDWCTSSMSDEYGSSIQYCLVDVLDTLNSNIDIDIEDLNYLKELSNEGVDYIEIVY